MQSFRIDVPEAVLVDLRSRLGATRWPDPLGGWELGTEPGYLQELCEHWRSGYDWRVHEAALNRWDHVVTEVDGQRLHALHAPSPHAGALPLVVTHGWPGSVAEFTKVIEPLRDPVAHGGDAADAFHVICPSIPGYGWSGPTRAGGWNARRCAGAIAALVHELGYDTYGAQGGDWGATISLRLPLVDPGAVAGVHVNMVTAPMPDGFDLAALTPEEQQGLAESVRFFEENRGYLGIQGTRPQTLAPGLNDSPAALAGWIVEKFRAWSDCGGDIESSFTKDELLTNITIYWVTETINSSCRLYFEAMRSGEFAPLGERLDVPVGCATFPRDVVRTPRAWAEAAYDVRRWSVFDRGGHFAAMEEPQLLVDDVRAFFRGLR